MKGFEIADNLKNSALGWTRSQFVRRHGKKRRYCVVGMKLHEAGIPDDLLSAFPTVARIVVAARSRGWKPKDRYVKSRLIPLEGLNDEATSRGMLALLLATGKRRNKEYPLDDLIDACRWIQAHEEASPA